ncbi:MAG TPA: hypothetical protein VGQ85_06100 [Candidatus Limnocylindrales bacterium]|nr:hypothetical protein [Candidatus Limnocylindrales bacterium]
MTDSPAGAAPGTDPTSSSRCPWCSAQVTPETAICPSCGAKLLDDAAAEIPGVTQLDPAATAPRPTPRSRGLIGWLSGDFETTESDSDRAGVEPPTDAVKQEMLRLEMEALKTELEGEAAERAAAQGEPVVAEAEVGEDAEPEQAAPSPDAAATDEPEPGADRAAS